MKHAIGTIAILAFVLAPLALAQVRQGSWTPVVESMERGYSSISYWTYRDDGVEIGGGRISVEHGKPSWPQNLDDPASFDAATIGRLWRLGNNKWSTLDSQLSLRFGERAVAPGIYYLILERLGADDWRLVFVSPKQVSEHLIDAWASQARPNEVPKLFSVPLVYSAGVSSTELDISLSLEPNDMSRGGLTIRWGPHQLDTVFAIDVVSPTFYRSKVGEK